MNRILLLVLVCMCGCLALGSRQETQVTRYLPKQTDACIFIANGSGDGSSLSINVSKVIDDFPGNIMVESFDWSHGRGYSLADHLDRENHDYQAKRLADQIMRLAAARGNSRIYMMGHSTGCAIVLAAAERLPPGSIDRIALLAPSVPDQYDLRPALTTTRYGIDSYNSSNDQLILGLGMMIVGTTDPNSRSAAGLNGFKPTYTTQKDTILYQKLRQHPWSPNLESAGNDGNHYGCITPTYLKTHVLPQLLK